MAIYKPSDEYTYTSNNLSVFLAGTIDNGSSIDWQKEAEEELQFINSRLGTGEIDIFNPRNDKWDFEIEQTVKNPEFKHQLQWEYDRLSNADLILMNFLSGSKSPITLLELGLFADTGKIIIVCPEEFWRRGNVEFVSDMYGIPRFDTLREAMGHIADIIDSEY